MIIYVFCECRQKRYKGYIEEIQISTLKDLLVTILNFFSAFWLVFFGAEFNHPELKYIALFIVIGITCYLINPIINIKILKRRLKSRIKKLVFLIRILSTTRRF